MDYRELDGSVCNGGGASDVVDSKDRVPLLQAVKDGGLAGRRPGRGRRTVQWNDYLGDKLTEVMEYQPRCSCEDWIRRNPILACISTHCCLGSQRSP